MEKTDFRKVVYDAFRLILALALLVLWFFLKPENIPPDVLVWGLIIFLLHFFEVKLPYVEVYLFYPLLLSTIFSLNLTTATLLSLFAPVKKSDIEERKGYREGVFQLCEYVIAVQAGGWGKYFLLQLGYPYLSWAIAPLAFFLVIFIFKFLNNKLLKQPTSELVYRFFINLLIGTLLTYVFYLVYLFSSVGGVLSFLGVLVILISFQQRYAAQNDKTLLSFLNLASSIEEKVLHQPEKTRTVYREGEKILSDLNVKDKEASWALVLFNLGLLPVSSILKKEGRLSEEEYSKVKEHPVLVAEALEGEGILLKASEIIRFHHETFSGTGYPEGKMGEAIPLVSRLIHLLQAYAAMISPRPYRRALTEEEALKEIRFFSGVQFDPQLVEKFLALKERKVER